LHKEEKVDTVTAFAKRGEGSRGNVCPRGGEGERYTGESEETQRGRVALLFRIRERGSLAH